MKILLLVEACGAGVGRHVLDLCTQLQADHELHLVYSPVRADRAFARGIGPIRAYPLPLRRGPAPSDISAMFRLRRYVRRHGPFDVIHSHSTKAGLLMRSALAGMPGVRIHTPHAPMTMDPSLSALQHLPLAFTERLLALRTDRIICVSQEELDHLHELGIPREKLALVPNGIDLPGYVAHSKPARPFCIGFLGRLAPQKNLSLLLRAFAQLQDPTAILAIAGKGPSEPSLRTYAQRLGIASRVQWLGESDASVLSQFDVFALPSLYEGLPYVLLESMAASLPIVSTRVGGVSQLVAEGVNGFAVPVNDTEAFAQALQKFRNNPGLSRAMGAASRQRVQEFTVSRMTAGILNVYRSSMAGHSSRTYKHLINVLKNSPHSAD